MRAILRSTISLSGAFMQLIPYTKRKETGSISTIWVRITHTCKVRRSPAG